MFRKLVLLGLIVFLGWIAIIPLSSLGKFKDYTLIFVGLLCIISILSYKSKKALILDKYDLPFWLFLVGMIPAVFFAQADKWVAYKRFLDFVIPSVILYFLLKSGFRPEFGAPISRMTCLFASIIALLGLSELVFHRNFIYEYLVNNPYYSEYIHWPRIMSTKLHPAVLGSFLVGCLPFSLYLIKIYKSKISRVLAAISMVLIFLGILFSLTRGSIIAAIVALVIYLCLKKSRLVKKFIFAVIIVYLIFLIASTSIQNPQIKRLGWQGLVGWFHYRGVRFSTTFKMFKDHPFFGVGLNNYRPLFDKYHVSKCVAYEFKIPDNMYLMILGETGLLGFSLFLVFIFFLLKGAFKTMPLIRDDSLKEFLLVTMAALIGILVNMFTYELFYWTEPMYQFWILVGLIVAITQEVRYARDIKTN
ncbi:MAG: O-antigen ligase family protein [Candidatus Omnitrophota bacterium]